MTPSDADILAALPGDRSLVPISDLAGRLRITIRKLGPLVERLATRGAVVIDRTGPERAIRLDGDDVQTWRSRAIATQARLDDLVTATERAAALLGDALLAARGPR